MHLGGEESETSFWGQFANIIAPSGIAQITVVVTPRRVIKEEKYCNLHHFVIFQFGSVAVFTLIKMPIIGVEGFQLSNIFIVKELYIQIPSREFRQFIFKNPKDLQLNDEDLRTVRYTTRHLSGLSYTDGDVPYDEVAVVLNRLKNCTIYTYGYTARNFLRTYLPTTVIVDIQELGFNMPTELPKTPCFINHRPRYCARAKADAIRLYLESNAIEYWYCQIFNFTC